MAALKEKAAGLSTSGKSHKLDIQKEKQPDFLAVFR
jgi:hypothetical protein